MIKSTSKQKCIDCGETKLLKDFPVSNIHKLGVQKRCTICQRLKNSKKSAGQVARSLIKSVEMAKGARPKTTQQLKSIASAKEFGKVKKAMFAAMLDESGGTHYHCQHSGIIIPVDKKHMLSAHHIVFQSELRNHPDKHNEANIIIILRYDMEYYGETIKSIHDWYHERKDRRKKLVEERNLEALYGKSISFYGTDIKA